MRPIACTPVAIGEDAMKPSTRAGCLVAALGLSAVFTMKVMPTAGSVRLDRPGAAPAGVETHDPARFILNALLAPALDEDAAALRWMDPRPASQCGAGSSVRVNGAPLVAGALVPDAPFELEWQADGCRFFGARGPRFDGRVKLTVYRENWGFSAMVEPAGMRVTWSENEAAALERGGATLPQCIDSDDPEEATPAAACR
jgi:hypothetical protein